MALSRRPLDAPVVFAGSVSLLCFAASAFLIWTSSVNVPAWDQFFSSFWLTEFNQGTMRWVHLLAQHNESRMVFPTLLTIPTETLARGDVRFNLVWMLALAALTLYHIARLAWLTIPGKGWGAAAVTSLAALLIFSPVQSENWLWGHQVGLFFPLACLTTGIRVAYSSWPLRLQWIVCGICSLVATFSFANGMFCWLVFPPLLLMQSDGIVERVRSLFVWLLAAAACLAAFFTDYHTVSNPTDFGKLLADPTRALACLAGFLTGSLTSGIEAVRVQQAAGLAALLLALYAVVAVTLVAKRRQGSTLGRAAGWCTMAAFVVVSGVVTTLGRMESSAVALTESRYTTFSIYLLIALAALLAVLYEHWPPFKHCAVVALAAVFFWFHGPAVAASIAQMRQTRVDRLQTKACWTFVNVVPEACSAARLYPSFSDMLGVTESLDQLGLMHPRLVRSADISGLAEPSSGSAEGSIESLGAGPDGYYRVAGHARLRERQEPADAILFTYTGDHGQPVAFALSVYRRNFDPAETGWLKWLLPPSQARDIRAWAYDAVSGRAHPLGPARLLSQAQPEPLRQSAAVSGALERISLGPINFFRGNDPMLAYGFSVLPEPTRPADAVLITCADTAHIVGTGDATQFRPDLVRQHQSNAVRYAGWVALIRAERLPPEGCNLRAWAYNAATGEVLANAGARDSNQLKKK